MMFVPHRKHIYKSSLPVSRISLHFFIYMMFVPHRKHAYRPPRVVTWIALTFLCKLWLYFTGNTPMGLHGVTEITLLLYTYMSSYLTGRHLWASTACYGASFTVLYVHDFRTSQETFMGLCSLLRGWLYFFICRCSYVTANTPDVRTSQETYLWASTACYGDSITFFICRWRSYLTGNTPMCLYGLACYRDCFIYFAFTKRDVEPHWGLHGLKFLIWNFCDIV
jgi:hypothetical protein